MADNSGIKVSSMSLKQFRNKENSMSREEPPCPHPNTPRSSANSSFDRNSPRSSRDRLRSGNSQEDRHWHQGAMTRVPNFGASSFDSSQSRANNSRTTYSRNQSSNVTGFNRSHEHIRDLSRSPARRASPNISPQNSEFHHHPQMDYNIEEEYPQVVNHTNSPRGSCVGKELWNLRATLDLSDSDDDPGCLDAENLEFEELDRNWASLAADNEDLSRDIICDER